MNKLPLIIVFLIVFVASFFITGFFIQQKTPSQAIVQALPTQIPTPTPTPDPLAPQNILIMGYGGGKHDGGSLTDTMMIAHVRPREERVVLITIPRDLWVSLPTQKEATEGYKMNAAYAIGVDHKNYPNKPPEYMGKDGGRKLASYAILQATGLSIDHAVSISFDGFLKAIGLLEPLTVVVPQTFTDQYYPVEGKETDSCGKSEDEIKQTTATLSGFLLEREFPCRYESISYTQGKQQLSALEALKFVRSRHSDTDGGDFSRSRRQAALLDAIKNKIATPLFLPKLIPLATSIISSVDTDITIKDLPEMIQLYSNFHSFKITTLSLTIENVLKEATGPQGQYILVPKDNDIAFSSIHQYIQKQVNQQTTSPTSVIQ